METPTRRERPETAADDAATPRAPRRRIRGPRVALALTAAVVVTLGLTGCDGRGVLVGHAFSFVATAGMLWSTLNLNRDLR